MQAQGSAITEVAPGHFLLELDEVEGPASQQLRKLLLDPLARRGVRVYIAWSDRGAFPADALDMLQSLELKFRIHGGGVGIISTDPLLVRRMRVTGLIDLLPLYHSVEMAVESGRRIAEYQSNPFLEVS